MYVALAEVKEREASAHLVGAPERRSRALFSFLQILRDHTLLLLAPRGFSALDVGQVSSGAGLEYCTADMKTVPHPDFPVLPPSPTHCILAARCHPPGDAEGMGRGLLEGVRGISVPSLLKSLRPVVQS